MYCSDKSKSVELTEAPAFSMVVSNNPAAEKAAHDPHWPWFLTVVLWPSSTELYESGIESRLLANSLYIFSTLALFFGQFITSSEGRTKLLLLKLLFCQCIKRILSFREVNFAFLSLFVLSIDLFLVPFQLLGLLIQLCFGHIYLNFMLHL